MRKNIIHRVHLSRNFSGHHFFFQAEDGIRDYKVTGVQTCALPIFPRHTSLHQLSLAPTKIDCSELHATGADAALGSRNRTRIGGLVSLPITPAQTATRPQHTRTPLVRGTTRAAGHSGESRKA